MQCLFEGGYYFASLYAQYGINLRAATKQGAESIQANTVNGFCLKVGYSSVHYVPTPLNVLILMSMHTTSYKTTASKL